MQEVCGEVVKGQYHFIIIILLLPVLLFVIIIYHYKNTNCCNVDFCSSFLIVYSLSDINPFNRSVT